MGLVKRSVHWLYKGNKIIHTYAFLDPGSTATFCRDKLMHQLNMRGKETFYNILLRTMGQERQ